MVGSSATAQSAKRRYYVNTSNPVTCYGTAVKNEGCGVPCKTTYTYLCVGTSSISFNRDTLIDVMLVGGGGTGSSRAGGGGGNVMISDSFCIPAGTY